MAGTNVDVINADATAMPLEDDRFTGAVSFTMLHHVPSVELQDRLFAEVARVLAPHGVFVAADSIASDDLAAFHDNDIYNPIDHGHAARPAHAGGFRRCRRRGQRHGLPGARAQGLTRTGARSRRRTLRRSCGRKPSR